MPSTPDDAFMQEALRLAVAAVANGGGPFGAVVVRDGVVLARGVNQVTSGHDPTAHAEIVAIRDACRRLQTFSLAQCEMYTTCEPCPMCLGAILWARLAAVYFAGDRRHASRYGFDDEHFYRQAALAPAEREIPMWHVSCEGALAPFEAWQNKADRQPY